MTLETTILTNFTAGELSPLMRGRPDVTKYYNGCDTELNMVSLPQGGATKRPGTRHVIYARDSWPGPLAAAGVDSANPIRLIDFTFSVVQAYMIELGVLGISRAVTGTADNGGGLIRLQMASTAGLFTGCTATVSGVGGTTAANGTWTLTVIDATHVDLQGSAYSGAYTSGGTLATNGGYARFYKDGGQIVRSLTVSGAANNGSGLIRLTVNSTSGVVTGNHATVSSVGGTTEANGVWIVTLVDATHIDLQGSTFAHAYTSGGTAAVPVEIAMPYAAGQLPAIGYVQSTDTLYLFHPAQPIQSLVRSSHTDWTRTAITQLDGPYLPVNVTGTTVTPSGTTGSITLAFSSTTGVNGDAGLASTDVNRLMRIKDSAAWGWVKITGVSNATLCSASVQSAVTNGAAGQLDGTSATVNWQLGAWSETTGYPFTATFFQQRLSCLGDQNQPSAIRTTITSGFNKTQLTFSPTDSAGTVTATHALTFVISDDQVNAGRWIKAAGSAQSMQLGIGTNGGENILQPATQSAALSATNVQVYPETSYGSRFTNGASISEQTLVRPLRIGKAILFPNRPGRRLHEWQFDWKVNGYIGPDLVELSEHITETGIQQLAYQQNPFSVIWGYRGDGQLVSFTYRPDQQVFAPSRHRLGGEVLGGTPPVVESLACIPSTDSSYDELWLSVQRNVKVGVGLTNTKVRYIEVLTRYFRVAGNNLALEQAVFADSAATSDLTYPAATCTFTTTDDVITGISLSAGVLAGNSTDLKKVIRMNGGKFVISAAGTTTAATVTQIYMPSSQAPAASGSWSLTTPFTSATAAHLPNATLSVLGEGAKYPQATTTSAGALTLSPASSLVTAGLPYSPELVTMRYETSGSGPRTAQGRVKRIIDLYLRLFETGSCQYGPAATEDEPNPKLDQILTRSSADLMGQASPLVSKDFRVPMPGGSNKEGQILATQDEDPLPLTILGIVADVDVGQRKAAS